ncbi:ATP-grasp domain-containing protein [Lederbergia citri]|uniref:ATP-grasp domain-containing protein n=1 Tax=Lederbergia citri TaxID=2833580 RepID=A0A942TBY8_9BACI|nr:ATP-grasp domain-containing protein [Lederbergia citri]MBS4194890.1 ATP-grasp domain-containing protein [Lederbergia citri]
METIIFIGSNKTGTSKEALTTAKEMGYCIVLFTNRKNLQFSDVDNIIYTEDLFNERIIFDEITKLEEQGKHIRACLSFIDPFVSYAANLSKKLGLVHLSIDSLSLMENKIMFREKLKNLPSSPSYSIVDPYTPLNEINYMNFPLIVKSPISNGSKDVIFVDCIENLKEGIQILQKKDCSSPILVEEYLHGTQYLIEIIVYNSEISIAAIIKQEVANGGKIIVVGYQYPSGLKKEIEEKLVKTIEKIIEELGFTNGACHLEMKYMQDNWKLVEINPRMSGGYINSMIELGTGIHLIKEIIKMNLGEHPSLVHTKKDNVYSRYVTIKSRGTLLKVVGKEKALKHIGVKHVYIKPNEGDVLTEPYSMGNRYACVIAVGESMEAAKKNAINASKEIQFYLDPF